MSQLQFHTCISDMTLKEIESHLKQEGSVEQAIIDNLLTDPRKGTTTLAKKYIKRNEEASAEKERLYHLKRYEDRLHAEEYTYIAGVDEVGRGSLAGPVTACAVILPSESMIFGIKDSKQVCQNQREKLHAQIVTEAIAVGMGSLTHEKTDRYGIGAAVTLAMKRAVTSLSVTAEYILIDGNIKIPGLNIPHDNILQGDQKHYSIAAASIVAKVRRDQFMNELNSRYPGYGFAENKGYGTKEHLEAVERYGYCPVHRNSFRFHDKDQLKLGEIGHVPTIVEFEKLLKERGSFSLWPKKRGKKKGTVVPLAKR